MALRAEIMEIIQVHTKLSNMGFTQEELCRLEYEQAQEVAKQDKYEHALVVYKKFFS